MTGLSIIENIVADIIFILIALVVGRVWIGFTKRRKLQAFFGVSSSKRLIVYVSNLRIQTFGAVGISGRKMSYSGSSVAYGEMQAANRIKDLFSFIIPSVAETSEFLRRLLVSDVAVQILISPISVDELEKSSTYISLGSLAYNAASQNIEENTGSHARFRLGVLKKSDVNNLTFPRGPMGPTGSTAYSTERESFFGSGSTVSLDNHLYGSNDVQEKHDSPAIIIEDIPPFEDLTYGFIERVFEPENDRMLFYIAGLSEYSTKGAAFFLSSEWKNLYRKYGADKPFIVMIRVDDSDPAKWSVVLEKDSFFE